MVGKTTQRPIPDLSFLKNVLSGSFPTGVPEIVFFEDENFEGADWRTNLPHLDVGSRNIGSLIIVHGNWDLFPETQYQGQGCPNPSQGYYPSLPALAANTFFQAHAVPVAAQITSKLRVTSPLSSPA
jgi:hypothetical protein